MTTYPDHAVYKKLYLRYYDRCDIVAFLRLIEPIHGRRVLDLCGGDGRLALGSLKLGARESILVDGSREMVPPDIDQHLQLRVCIGDVNDVLSAMRAGDDFVDRIVCRQAVNYWLNEHTAVLATQILTPQGIFAFNTFNQEPSEAPRVLQYELQGCSFVEVSWRIGSIIHHLQVRDGLPPHYTSFEWLSPELLRTILEPHFDVNEQRHGKTSLYRCVKK